MAGGSEARRFGDSSSPSRAFEALYAEHAPALRVRCRRLTHDSSSADDLMQEVFARFLERFPEPPADMNVRAYLHATARNVLWKQLRDDHEFADEDIVATVGADDRLERDPERAALLAEQRGLVQRCAALLSGRQRRALALREVDGRSYAEIGGELGIGDEAVGQVITRARARLRGALRRAQIDLDQLPAGCRALLGPLSDYVEGRGSASALEFERHLDGCAACRATLAAYQEAGSRLRAAAPLAPLATLLARIGDAVRAGGDGPVSAGALASAAAAVIALGGSGLVLAHHVATAPATQPRSTPHVALAPARALRVRDTRPGAVLTAFAATPPATVSRSAGAAVGPAPVVRQRARAPRASTGRHPRPITTHAPARAPGLVPALSSPTLPRGTDPPHTTAAQPPTATSPATTVPHLPKVVAPPVTVPGIVKTAITPGRDGITTPSVSVPGIATPAVTTPAVTVPGVSVPAIATPPITTPVGDVPSVTVPAVPLPSVTVPAVSVPAVTLPDVTVPAIRVKVP